jgi:hypothetical protein
MAKRYKPDVIDPEMPSNLGVHLKALVEKARRMIEYSARLVFVTEGLIRESEILIQGSKDPQKKETVAIPSLPATVRLSGALHRP